MTRIRSSVRWRRPLVVAMLALILPPYLAWWSHQVLVAAVVATYVLTRSRGGALRTLVFLALGSALFVTSPFASFVGAGLLVAVSAGSRPRPPGRWGGLLAYAAFPGLVIALLLAVRGADATALEITAWLPPHVGRFSLLLGVKLLALHAFVEHRSAQRKISLIVLGAVTILVLVTRVRFLATLATSPVELYWCEAPFMMNALKLHHGALLYGPPEELDSYSYGPVMDLLGRAMLSPFSGALSLPAHRALGLSYQIGAAALLCTAMRPWLRGRAKTLIALSFTLVLLASLSNLVGGAVHPDHLLLLLAAATVGMLLIGVRPGHAGRPETRTWQALCISVLVALAVATKLSGVGLVVGVATVGFIERDRRLFASAIVGATAAALFFVAFDATLGTATFYVIRLQSLHARSFGRLLDVSFMTFFRALLAMSVVGAAVAWRRPWGALGIGPRRVAVIALAALVSSLPACIKVAGRDNNLTLPFVLVVVAVLLFVLERRTASGGLQLVIASGLVADLAVRPPERPPAFSQLREDARRIVLEAREASKRGENVCSPATPLVEAGARPERLPGPRLQSAVELDLARRSEAGGLVDALAKCDLVLDMPGAVSARGIPVMDAWSARLVRDFDEVEEPIVGRERWYRWMKRRSPRVP